MRALAKVGGKSVKFVLFVNQYLIQLVAVNNPDKIIFVGEALVGNEAVDQLTKFDRALRDFSSASGAGRSRGIDGMLVTKWDTVDDKVSGCQSVLFPPNDVEYPSQVGAALSMTYVTGQPIIFVGCGQVWSSSFRNTRKVLMTSTDIH